MTRNCSNCADWCCRKYYKSVDGMVLDVGAFTKALEV